jgi:hypothetical protein
MSLPNSLCHITFRSDVCVCFQVSLVHYEPNPEWKLLSATSSREFKDLEDDSVFPWIRYSFVLQRHSRMYEATVGVPALGKAHNACVRAISHNALKCIR